MDIFKIRLDKFLNNIKISKLEKILLSEKKINKEKIRKYTDYILK